MSNRYVQGAEDRIVTDKNASGQAKVAEIKVFLFLYPYISAFE
jgi:hypothetical protein